jgi:hypothetical protein
MAGAFWSDLARVVDLRRRVECRGERDKQAEQLLDHLRNRPAGGVADPAARGGKADRDGDAVARKHL